MEKITWPSFCRELAEKIIERQNRRAELIEIVKESVEKVGVFKDNFSIIQKNNDIEPFTFMAMPLTVGTDKRKDVFQIWKEKFKIKQDVPNDFPGMPQLNPTNAGFFGEHSLLWQLFGLAYKYPKLSPKETNAFKQCLNSAIQLNNVGMPKLTMVLFVINTNLLSCDQNSLQNLNIQIKNVDDYVKAIKEANSTNINFLEVSINGYQEKTKTKNQKNDLKQKFSGFDTYLQTQNISTRKTYINGLIGLMEETDIDLWKKNDRDKIWDIFEQGTFNTEYKKNKHKSTISNIKTYLKKFIEYSRQGEDEIIDTDMTINMENKNSPKNSNPGDEPKKFPLNQILYGPPGTGKTYNSVIYAVAILGGIDIGDDYKLDTYTIKELQKKCVDRAEYEKVLKRYNKLKKDGYIEFITFHQSYGYEEFIQGIKPIVIGKGDERKVIYKVEDGIFKKFCDNAEGKGNCVFIIDEINRGNVSKIFGELITLIEEGKRISAKDSNQGMTVKLPYKDENGKDVVFGVPDNVYILGTMNTADRSLVQLDAALRRRFRFIEMMPKPELLSAENKKDNQTGVDLEKLLTAINERICALIDREHQIGHSYFMKVKNIDDLRETFQYEIIPLLQEYFYEDYENIDRVLNGNGFIQPKPKKFDVITFEINVGKFKYVNEKEKLATADDFIAIYDNSTRDKLKKERDKNAEVEQASVNDEETQAE